MFARFVTKDVTVKVTTPEVVAVLGSDQVVVTIQKLSGSSLEKTRIQRTIVQAAPLRAYGAELLKGLQSKELDEAAAALAAKKTDPADLRKLRYDAHDRESTLMAGIIRWSCEEKFPLGSGADKAKSISDLEEAVAQQLHEEIVDLSAGPITAAEAQAKEGESSGRSTAF